MSAPVVLLAALGEEARAVAGGAIELATGAASRAGLGLPVVLTGVGKVAAAAALQRAVLEHRPRAVVMVGVAGGLAADLRALSVVVARDAVQWDVDLTAFGSPPGTLNDGRRYLEMDETGTRLALEAALELGYHARAGRVATGDSFLADAGRARWIAKTFEADAVEMEGAAAAQVAADNGVPMVLVRVISDAAGDGAAGSFEAFLRQASDRAARIVGRFLPRWADVLSDRADLGVR